MSDPHESNCPVPPVVELSDGFLAQLLYMLPHPVALKDRHYRWVFVNEVTFRLLGIDRADVIGKTD